MKTIEIVMLVLISILVVAVFVMSYVWWYQNKKKNSVQNQPSEELTQLISGFNNLKTDVTAQYSNQDQNNSKNAEKFAETITKISENGQKFTELKQEVNSLKDNQLQMMMINQQKYIEELNNLINNVKKVDDGLLDLNKIFYNAKIRGNLGEFTLETLLTNLFGTDKKIWESQYELYVDEKRKGAVDYVIHTVNQGEDIIIDSKFPLDNYRSLMKAIEDKESDASIKNKKETFKKDIKAKVNEVTKYLNKKNNVNSVILFIPSEGIFNFIVDEFSDVMDQAISKKVWLTSPTGLAALLNIINEYLKDYELSNNLEAIKDEIMNLQPDFLRFAKRWENIKKDINHLEVSVKDLDTSVDKITKKQQKIIDANFEIEAELASD